MSKAKFRAELQSLDGQTVEFAGVVRTVKFLREGCGTGARLSKRAYCIWPVDDIGAKHVWVDLVEKLQVGETVRVKGVVRKYRLDDGRTNYGIKDAELVEKVPV